jgi:two-component system sensor histidine kinase AlgZ
MTSPPASVDDAKAPAGRPASARPAELRQSSFGASQFPPTQFGSTVFDSIHALGQPLRRSDALVFDVCHVGVVLRALLLAHVVIAIGVLFVSNNPAAWLGACAAASAVALPAVLVWLLLACLMKQPLARLSLTMQWLAAGLLGAASGIFGWVLGSFSGLDLFAPERGLAPAAAGAAMAAAMFQWLRMRALARLPADTTARLAELQSRIRPHFLFNTLNTALSLVRLDPPRAEGVLEDLAELFRVAITGSGESATLADEVDLARRYLAIEQIRFGARLQVSWELDPEAGAARVPPLLLQPLVENAVRHGIEPADEGGVIRVRTRVRRGRAELMIVNTLSKNPSRSGNGIALRNVRERLRLMHDVASQFEARREGEVFRVQIFVPL